MNNHRGVKILIEITDNQINIIHGGPYNINGGNAMNLLAVLVDVKVESDVVLSKVLEFHESGDNVEIVVVEDYYFPDVLFLVEYLLVKVLLLLDQIYFGLWLILHAFWLRFSNNKVFI